jgi:hypothetical protein
MLPSKKGPNRGDDMLETEAIVGAGRAAQEGFNLTELELLQPIGITIDAEELQKPSEHPPIPTDRGLRQSTSLTKIHLKTSDLFLHRAGRWNSALGHQMTLNQKAP